jgi:hypothetical protein
MGRQRPAVRAWILVERPPRERPDSLAALPRLSPEAERWAFTAEEAITPGLADRLCSPIEPTRS